MGCGRPARPLPVMPAKAGIQYAVASRFITTLLSLEYWIPACAGMTTEYDCAFSRRVRPRFAVYLAPGNRGRREDRVRAAPAVSRALLCKRIRTRAYRFSGSIRPSLRNGFTAYFVLFPVNGFLATVAPRADPRNLTPAPRRQNHTTSPYATGQPRQSWPPRPPHPTARS